MANDFQAFHRLCLRLLARREYSLLELKQKGKNFPPHVVEAVLNDLIERNWQSDERFCEHYVRSHASRGDGPLKIRQKLKMKGIDNTLIDAHLKTIDWQASANALYQKKYHPLADDPYREKQKCQRFLAQRGFSFSTIQEVVKS